MPQLSALKQVKCTGVARLRHERPDGDPGGDVGLDQWRTDIARQLWTLHDQGCNVYVVLNNKRVGEKVYRALLKRSSRHGVMRVYDAWYGQRLLTCTRNC